MKNHKFDIEYIKWLRQVDVEEDNAVWEEIQYELDFIETWDNISVRLDEVKPQKGKVIQMKYVKSVAAAAAFILLMLLPVKYFNEQAVQPSIISEQQNSGVNPQEEFISDEASPLRKEKADMDLAKMAEIEAPPVIRNLKKPSAHLADSDPTALAEDKDFEDSVFNDEQMVFDKIQSRSFDADSLIASNNPPAANFPEKQTSVVSESGKASGVSLRVVDLGLLYGYKNTWLLNYETLNGLNPRKLGRTIPAFHQDIGASSTLEFNDQHLFGLEFFWKSETGQNYQQYINANFVDRQINLNYRKFQAFYIRDNNKIPGQVLLGGYIAKLTLAREMQGNTMFSVNDNYHNLDYGLLAGYQLNIALRNKIIIKPGIRVNYNLMNIFEGDDVIPAYLKKTRKLAASFNTFLSYRFSN